MVQGKQPRTPLNPSHVSFFHRGVRDDIRSGNSVDNFLAARRFCMVGTGLVCASLFYFSRCGQRKSFVGRYFPRRASASMVDPALGITRAQAAGKTNHFTCSRLLDVMRGLAHRGGSCQANLVAMDHPIAQVSRLVRFGPYLCIHASDRLSVSFQEFQVGTEDFQASK